MMRYAFTGPSRELTDAEKLGVVAVVQELDPTPTEIHTGCALGVDTAAAQAAKLAWPDAEHHLWVPGTAPHNRELVREVIYGGPVYVVHTLLDAGDHVATYMARNDELVAHCDRLVAFPETRRESVRSGTWATIRRARKAGRIIFIQPLEEM